MFSSFLYLIIAVFACCVKPQSSPIPSGIITNDWCVVSSPVLIYKWDGTGSIASTSNAYIDARHSPADLCPSSTAYLMNYTTCNLYPYTITCNSSYLVFNTTIYQVPFLYPIMHSFLTPPSSCLEIPFYNVSLEYQHDCSTTGTSPVYTTDECDEICFDNEFNTTCGCGNSNWCTTYLHSTNCTNSTTCGASCTSHNKYLCYN
jgi:hypothetical protein